MAVPANWFKDPKDPAHYKRWWDGTEWADDRKVVTKSETAPERWPTGVPMPPLTKSGAARHRRNRRIKAGVTAGIVAAIVVAVVVDNAIQKPSSGSSSSNDAKNFIAPIQQNATATSVDATGLLTEVFAVADTQDLSGLVQIASDAQQLHDHLKAYRTDLLGAPGSYKTDESAFVDAENDLKNACGDLDTWTGNPNASTSAKWQNSMARAVVEWNAAATKLWTEASETPPTITIPS